MAAARGAITKPTLESVAVVARWSHASNVMANVRNKICYRGIVIHHSKAVWAAAGRERTGTARVVARGASSSAASCGVAAARRALQKTHLLNYEPHYEGHAHSESS